MVGRADGCLETRPYRIDVDGTSRPRRQCLRPLTTDLLPPRGRGGDELPLPLGEGWGEGRISSDYSASGTWAVIRGFPPATRVMWPRPVRSSANITWPGPNRY